jgi:hypothetical protein
MLSANSYKFRHQREHLKYVLTKWSFVVIKLPEDGTLVPKHVGDGTSHEVCLMICVVLYFTWSIFSVNMLKACRILRSQEEFYPI